VTLPPNLRPLVRCRPALVGEARQALDARLVRLVDEIFECRQCALEVYLPELGAELGAIAPLVGQALADLRKVKP
jgi:hypothetical protein